VPTPLPGVVEGEDLWTLEVPPEPTQAVGFRWRVPLFIAGFVALFLIGVAVAMSGVGSWAFGWFQPTVRPTPAPVVVAPPWTPGVGPLERGLLLDSEPPQVVRWSPDGSAIAWVAFDAKRGVPVARTVAVLAQPAGYGQPEVLHPMPDWTRSPAGTELSASIAQGGLVLTRADGSTAGLVDLAGQYGYAEPRLPALSEAGGRVRVAFVATTPGAEEKPRATLHILDVTGLVGSGAGAVPVPGNPAPSEDGPQPSANPAMAP
jgi:hypothetical protein